MIVTVRSYSVGSRRENLSNCQDRVQRIARAVFATPHGGRFLGSPLPGRQAADMWPPRSKIVNPEPSLTARRRSWPPASPAATGGDRRSGPVGLCMAIDLAQHGIDTLLLDEDDKASEGSRAICFAKRTLEILDRLGVGQRAVDKGVVWNVGKVFFRDRQLYQFDLLPESGHKRPAFINLQQYYLEAVPGRPAVAHGPRGSALAQPSRPPSRRARRPSAVTVSTPDGEYAARVRLSDRGRRLAQRRSARCSDWRRRARCSAIAS